MNTKKYTQLPKHSPDSDLWNRIESSLDAIDAENILQQQLQELPTHTPDTTTWLKIEHKLNRIIGVKRALQYSTAIAALLLLLIGIRLLIKNTTENNSNTTPLAITNKTTIVPNTTIAKTSINNALTPIDKPKLQTAHKTEEPHKTNKALTHIEIIEEENITSLQLQPLIPNPQITEIIEPLVENKNTDDKINEESTHKPSTNIINTVIADKNTKTTDIIKKYVTPSSNTNHTNILNLLAVGVNYFPENVYNGKDNSMFHNIDFTAFVNKEKIRFHTSIGMVFNEEKFKYDVSYDQYQPVLAPNANGLIDTIGYSITPHESNINAITRHEYFTYGFGVSRKLFSYGNFSTWLNAGAGVAIKLKKSNEIDEESVKKIFLQKHNATVNKTTISQPDYNPFNINFLTGIDFNYKILNKLSFTFTPMGRWFFKPILTKNNQPTDELTLGFRSGIRFDF